ncbi:MAG: DUF1972 domain-containing protein [Hespellia sp.]|nr:DUF1972 domain-containing protein [Hespellia sp.]
MQHIFIVGSKGIPANYGGFETFVDKLTENQKDKNICYYVACMAKDKKEFEYNGAKCFDINVPNIGPAKAIYYDIAALSYCIRYCKKHTDITEPIFYVLACRIGPFIGGIEKKIHQLGGKLYVNPDGHEWKRAKWSYPVRHYWKLSERFMVKSADLLICDSKNIEEYIKKDYGKYQPKTTFIAYGTDVTASTLKDTDEKFLKWLSTKDLRVKEYYLVVGRFVPENNYETMIREFMKSHTKKSFALVSNVNDKFLKELQKKTNYKKDARIKFVGTVYDHELLKKIREQAYGYFHGHEVGGTNPSLLEALSSTNLNLLLNVGFNKEVAKESALYWDKQNGNLAELIDQSENLRPEEIKQLSAKAREIILKEYSWDYIVDRYEGLWNENNRR